MGPVDDYVTTNLPVTKSQSLRLSQGASLKPEESEGCSPVSDGRTIRLCSLWPSDDLPTPLRPLVDTGAGDRGGASAKFSVAAETVSCREGMEFEDTDKRSTDPNFAPFCQKSLGDCT